MNENICNIAIFGLIFISVAANSSMSIPDVKVRLTVNAQRSSRKIQNIVATLPGGIEQGESEDLLF